MGRFIRRFGVRGTRAKLVLLAVVVGIIPLVTHVVRVVRDGSPRLPSLTLGAAFCPGIIRGARPGPSGRAHSKQQVGPGGWPTARGG